jgi:hypothetical protein
MAAKMQSNRERERERERKRERERERENVLKFELRASCLLGSTLPS